MGLETIALSDVGASEVALVVKNPPAIAEDTRDVGGLDSWVRKSPRSRKPQPAPVFFPGKSHKQRSLVGYSLWGGKESDVTGYAQDIKYSSLCYIASLCW